MPTIELLEWSYTPSDYFEQSIEVVRDDYTMSIAPGEVTARLSADALLANPRINDEIHASLNDLFLGVQLMSYLPYTLSDPRHVTIHEDGRRDITFQLRPVSAVGLVGTLDVQFSLANGAVVYDSRADRASAKRTLAERVQVHRPSSAALTAMLASINTAVRDPKNELVHLYEVRDALSNNLGGKASAVATLGLSPTAWSRFGQLCNDEPLRQGRHRGKNGTTLRDATYAELQEARGIARDMLTRYLDYLDRNAPPSPN